jgi:hypothetical protein
LSPLAIPQLCCQSGFLVGGDKLAVAAAAVAAAAVAAAISVSCDITAMQMDPIPIRDHDYSRPTRSEQMSSSLDI